MAEKRQATVPDDTAVRTALWRALHVQADPPPHVLVDEVGAKLAAPAEGWQARPDMSPFTKPFRASILARARFIEDLVEEQLGRGVTQYVILGAGLDTFVQRKPELAARRSRLNSLGSLVPCRKMPSPLVRLKRKRPSALSSPGFCTMRTRPGSTDHQLTDWVLATSVPSR